MYFIEYRNFNRTLKNIDDIPIGCDIIEVWSEYVYFPNANTRSLYFNREYTQNCLIVSVDTDNNNNKQYRFAFNDKYIDDVFPPTKNLPNDNELESMFLELTS